MDRVNQKMKKFNLRGVLDGLRSSVSTAPKGAEWDVEETLRSEHFQVAKVNTPPPTHPLCSLMYSLCIPNFVLHSDVLIPISCGVNCLPASFDNCSILSIQLAWESVGGIRLCEGMRGICSISNGSPTFVLSLCSLQIAENCQLPFSFVDAIFDLISE